MIKVFAVAFTIAAWNPITESLAQKIWTTDIVIGITAAIIAFGCLLDVEQ